MDDECKEYKRGKPQQKLYKPGSGPLRRSGNGFDKMESYEVENGPKSRSHYGSHNSVNDLDINVINRHKKPEQQLYVPKSSQDMDRPTRAPMRCENNSSQYMNRRMSNKHDNKHNYVGSGSVTRGLPRRDRSFAEYQSKEGATNDINFNRNYRQVSEPRANSPTHANSESKNINRNRDSRSMETSAGRQGSSSSGSKPPSGRRNSAGYPIDSTRHTKHMVNLDNLPPRLRKKFLEQSGHHSFDSMDQKSNQYLNYSIQPNYGQGQYTNTNSNWSQTLPSRGRGRLRDNDSFDREKFLNSYLKNYQAQPSQRSTPSNSYLNLCEPNASEQLQHSEIDETQTQKKDSDYAQQNGIVKLTNNEDLKQHSEVQDNTEAVSHSSSNLLDMTNLDWTEEVEKNIKLDDQCDTSTSFTQSVQSATVSQETKPSEPRESKRKSRRRDKRSSSRGQINPEKKTERNRKDSNVSIQHDSISSSLKQRDRERRDSYKSNRSSTIGNSRDDLHLDHWRSLRSFSREQSTEGRIVSQCNSRDVSAHRALSPRDNDGFRVPAAVSKNAAGSSSTQKKGNGPWASGRAPSSEPRPVSPAPAPGAEGAGGARARRGGKRSGRRRARNAENIAPPAPHPPTSTNWREQILESKKHTATENTHHRNRLNSAMSDKTVSETSTCQPGLLILPQSSMSQLPKDPSRGGSVDTQKTLYDHHNPSKPIIVQTSPTQVQMRMERGLAEGGARGGYEAPDAARAARHCELLQQVDRADAVLCAHAQRSPAALADHWPEVADTRKFLQNALTKLLMSDLKYCQADNVEHNFWKMLYYNFIEKLRRSLTQVSPEDKPKVVKLINIIIEEGNVYFENLVQLLEKAYKFNTDDFINDNHVLPPKGLGYVGLALISVQKLYVFLGDLTRYKEQVNETNNYAKSKFWYTKAQQINPKNGRPYNQLAILAIYARRKLDAVYYYMRSLMSSNPFQSARESLLSLFDENRKKYEAAERKRRAAVETKPSENGDIGGTGARRELWLRPGGRAAAQDPLDDHLAAMTSVELNKNFITSYLHVHGKLITKIGMETFHESAARMLRQFRALLHRQPLPTPAARLLQLTALNMFAVETTVSATRGSSNAGERTAWLEGALGVSLLMFGAMLERCCALLPEPGHTQHHADALLLLPAIKVWSDWMLCHSCVWNPPPSFDNFVIGSECDPWEWLAKLMNILEALDDKSIRLESEMKEGYVSVRLAEDGSLGGFTPLMYMEPAAAWLRDPPPAHHAAEHALRTRKLLFFGTEYLVGVEPPVLRLEFPAGGSPRYVSAVQHAQAQHTPLQHLSEDSEDEDSASAAASGPPSLAEDAEGGPEGADEATRKLLRRKEQLESRKANMERRRQRMQEILRTHGAGSQVVVRPRWLVPDTNCFIDHLPRLQAALAAPAQPYVLVVPLVVLTELEGLSKCARVGERALAALRWVRAARGVRLATSQGSLLASRAFTDERELPRATNDDRVLATALNLHANLAPEPDVSEGAAAAEMACRVFEVVLLTDDRNLRVKALAAELPARPLPAFMAWAGLRDQVDAQNTQTDEVNEKVVSSK